MSKKQRWHEALAKPIKRTQKKKDRDPPVVPAGAGESNQGSRGSAARNSGASRESSRSRSSGSRSGNLGATTHTTTTTGNTSTSSTGSTNPGGALSSRGRGVGCRGSAAAAAATSLLCSSRSTPSLHLPSLSAAPLLRSYRSLSRLDQGSTRDETTTEHAMPNSRVKCGHLSSRATATIPGAHVSKTSRTNGGNSAVKMGMSNSSEAPSSFSSSSVVSNDVCRPHHHKRSEGVNHKKGWMMRQDSDGQWQRHWFVLANQILRFYRDSVAEEAADMDGEINLSTCYDITEYPAQKNYGFQIHTKDGVYTLCAMTSGTRQNWVQAVLTNVKPEITQEVKSVSTKSSGRSSQSLDSAGDTEDSKILAQDGCRQTRYGSYDPPEATNQQPQEQQGHGQHKTDQGPADGDTLLSESPSSAVSSSSRVSLAPSSSPVPRRLPYLEEEEEPEEQSMCNQRPLIIAATLTGATDSFCDVVKSPGVEGDGSKFKLVPLQSEGEPADRQADAGQRCQQVETSPQASISHAHGSSQEKEKRMTEPQTGQLLKELEQTQRQLARLQQLNKNLQDQLERERQYLLAGENQNGTSNSPLQATAFQRLQRINHDLRFELEAQRRSQDEAKEAELRRRVDLLAQQAQLLVTGDATALARIQLEKDRQRFQDRQVEWESNITSLQSQLEQSEDQRREAERSLLKLQQDAQGYQGVQAEADRLRERLQEVTARLRSNEEAQVQKEVLLQKHLVLLQESQDRERRSLASSLDQAECLSLDLQERLERAEQQVQCLSKAPSWTREIQDAQQQLQEELACTVAAVQKLQEEREQLRCHCRELENQLGEVDAEVNRLQNRLKTEETDYYNLEHSYERVSEDLQLALGKVEEREGELQDIREGYERLLDRKEQELSEVLVKMEILGNSLEETEVKLSEVLKVSTCASSEQDQSVISVQYDQRQNDEAPLDMSNGIPKVRSSTSPNGIEVTQQNRNPSNEEHARSRSCSIDPSFQYFVTNGDDQDRFMAVIQVLETKLYVTEEKLRDITQRLEDHQGHMICQDPHLCSQLTQSKATAQHLSLLLHKQAKQNQRFAQQTESRSRLLVNRFQAALTTLEAARQSLFALRQNLKDGHHKNDATELEKQLATVGAYLQQGEKNAEEQQQESYYSIREESRIIKDDIIMGDEITVLSDTASEEVIVGSTDRLLMKEALLVEKMILALQNREGIARLQFEPSTHDGDVVQRLKQLTSQKIDLKKEINSSESLEGTIGRVCTEAELIYTAFKLQSQYENCHDPALPPKSSLADILPPELAPYEEQIDPEDKSKEDDSKSISEEKEDKEQQLLDRLVSQLRRRAKTLRKLCQEICDSEASSESTVDHSLVNNFTIDSKGVQDQAMLIYLFERVYLDFNLEMQQCKEEHDRLQALCQEQDLVLMDEQQSFSQNLSQLQEENTILREQLEDIEQKRTVAEAGNQQLLENIQTIENYHKERIQKLEKEFQEKIKELQHIHEEEMKQLVSYYSKSASISDTTTSPSDMSNSNASMDMAGLEEPSSIERKEGQMNELDRKFQTTKEEFGRQMCDSDHTSTMRKAYQADFEKLKASCNQGISAMEEMYRQLVEDLKQQHQREVAELLREKDELLKEETAATMAAIVAMKRAHKEELKRSQWSQNALDNGDIAQLHAEYEKEIQALRKELEVLSAQHTHRCVENSEMGKDLERERQALSQCQKQIQELRNEEGQGLNATEDVMNTVPPVDLTSQESTSKSKDLHEMEISLRVQDTELQSLRLEAQTLREELKTALMDKAQTNSQKYASWSPTDPSPGESPTVVQGHASDDIIVAKSDSAFRRKNMFTRQIRVVRSKSLKEGLSVQERMKLFESL